MGHLNIPKFFHNEAQTLLRKRQEAIDIHGSDIRAAGNQIEISFRDWLTKMLPTSISTKHGHIIDCNSNLSPQLDCIITENKGISSLFRTADGTEYIPMDCIFSIGEIKSSYSRSQKYLSSFSKTLGEIQTSMIRKLEINTFKEGELSGDVLFHHLVRGSKRKYLNQLVSFIIFINSGDLTEEHFFDELEKNKNNCMPNFIIVLDKFVAMKARHEDDEVLFDPYQEHEDSKWMTFPLHNDLDSSISVEGRHLGFLYHYLLDHINSSMLSPPDIGEYMKDVMVGKKSQVKVLK